MEVFVTDAVMKLKVEEPDREQARKGASFLERASVLEHGGLGRCEECQKAISKARLQALPFTRFCVDCARKLQQSS